MTDEEQGKRLLNSLAKLAKTSSLSINELRIILAIERLIARLSQKKELQEHLVFKGGFVLLKTVSSDRFTRDLDASLYGISKELAIPLIESAVSTDLSDGLFYGPPVVEDLPSQGDYGGLRFHMPFQIGGTQIDEKKLKKLSRVHVDIGFGDSFSENIHERLVTPVLTVTPPLSWRVYSLESIFAEKLETVISRGSANSRGKDIYDLELLSKEISKSSILRLAIQNTFQTRKTELPTSFLQAVMSIDLTVLRASWASVDLQENISFDDCFESFKEAMKLLDLFLEDS